MAGGKGKLRPEDNPKPFVKGATPGPGHPKGVPNTKTRLKRLLEIVMTKQNPFTKETEGFSVAEQMDVALIAKALKGDVGAYREIMDRFEGKVTNTHEVKTDVPVTQPIINVIQGNAPPLLNNENDADQ